MKRALSIKVKYLLSELLCVLMLCGCDSGQVYDEEQTVYSSVSEYTVTSSYTETEATAEETEPEAETDESDTQSVSEMYSEESDVSVETDNDVILEQGSYTTPEDIAEYIHTFGTLPDNFITKKEAKALGWDSSKGNLWEVADGMSIGGDHFGNYEGLLPDADGRKWTECDVNYSGGYRGAERIIFSNDGLIYYTDDHYESFTQLY